MVKGNKLKENKMQNQHLKLHEIIWEITGKCNNHCEYCGSKEAWDSVIDNKSITQIAKNIALFPPDEIDISGGDPLLVNREVHEEIIKILKNKNVKCKVLVNPKSLYHENVVNSDGLNILYLYDWVGISVSTQEELDFLVNFHALPFCKKSTIISNFNLQNIFIYDEIEKFVKKHNLMWQVQYTMYKNSKNKLGIYNNEKALAFFSEKISNSINNGVKILIADNANCGKCGAGSHSIGILHNGDIVPCLSMRSWTENINDVVVGNILDEKREQNISDKEVFKYNENPLKYIWINRFNKYRFEPFKCCKDHCKNKCVEIKISKKIVTEKDFKNPLDGWEKYGWEKCKPIMPTPELPQVILYGVCPGIVQVYGVAHPEGTYVYGCPADWKGSAIYAVKTPPFNTCKSITLDSKTTTDYSESETKDKYKDK